MQVSNTILIVAIEIYAVLFVAAIILFVYTRRLKTLLSRQQEKILTLLRELQNSKKKPAHPAPTPPSAPPINPTQSYKNYLNDILEATSTHYGLISPDGNIGSEQAPDTPLLQRILALRYAFLRAEELGTTEPIGSTEYWDIFQQALEPLLPSGNNNSGEDLSTEISTYKKRIENLEKFKLLFFDMEKQWNSAQANAENYYEQLTAMSDELTNKQDFNDVLQQYHNVYNDIHQSILNTTENPDPAAPKTTINITRQDPRAAEEIVKLRNVAADQHRTINHLQRKLAEASSTTEKEAVFQELEQQLQRQIRFVQESEVCVQLLEEELEKAHAELSHNEKIISEQAVTSEENQKIKDALHGFSLESKNLISSLNILEKENETLKFNTTHSPTSTQPAIPSAELKKIQSEYTDLKKQYADLEEKYLDLKLKK